MRKFFKHIRELFWWLLIIVAFTAVDLDKYPIMHVGDYLFWPLIILTISLSSFYLWRYRYKACFLLAILFLTAPVWASGTEEWGKENTHTEEICSYYEEYKAKIEEYEKDHFKQDEACDGQKLAWARNEAAKYSVLNSESFTDGVKRLIGGIFSSSCADDLMEICSEYDSRHPPTVVKTVPVILNETFGNSNGGTPSDCWPCDMAYVVFSVIQKLSADLSEVMATVSLQMLIWFAVFWLLWKAAGMVLTSKGGTFFSQIAGGLIGVIIAAFILSNPNGLSTLYSKALAPVMQMGLSISESIVSSAGLEETPFYEKVKSRSASSGVSQTTFANYCGSSGSGSGGDIWSELYGQISGSVFPNLNTDFHGLNSSSGRTLLTDDLKMQFLCLTQKFYYQSQPFIATGQSLISFASHNSRGFLGFITRFPSDMFMWIVGALLVALFTYFSFLVAFKIMDIFLKLGFVLVIMPVFVATAVFPATREFTKKGWMYLFGIIVEFIGLAISATFSMVMLEYVITLSDVPADGEHFKPLLDAMTAEYSKDYGENLFKSITTGKTLTFPFLLFCAILIGQKLLKSFPIIIDSLFQVGDSSHKGEKGSMMGEVIGGVASNTVGLYKDAKKLANTAAQNPHKTKESKAQDAREDLNKKKKKLEKSKKELDDSKKKLERVKGTPQEAAAQKEVDKNKSTVDKDQKDVDESLKKYRALRAQADAEREKTSPSTSGYAARRFGYNSGNAIRKGSSVAAEAIEKFGSKVGGTLMKSGLGSLVGVPLVLGAKTLSVGLRAGAKVSEVGLKAAGRAGATVQKWNDKLQGNPPPPKHKP